jgi:phage terminase large subunit-like protein
MSDGEVFLANKFFIPDPSIAERISRLPKAKRHSLMSNFSDEECELLLYDWWFWGRKNQFQPAGHWYCWLVLAGRGFGKTRMGVEWIKTCVEGDSPLSSPKNSPQHIALIGQTQADGRDVIIEGESGFLANCRPGFRPKFEVSKRRLVWPNGIIAHLYSADEPDQLRGPQHHLAWGDELAKWKNGEECWSNLLFGLRLGKYPRVMVTTTPRPIQLLQKIIADPKTFITKGSTFDNSSNLSPVFIQQITRLYEGTRLGKQELDGELLEDVVGALWSHDLIDSGRCSEPENLVRIVVAVDPPVSHKKTSDACGIIVAGMDVNGHVYILADRSQKGLSPLGWAREALKAYRDYSADRLVAEVNNGGDLVEAVLRQIDDTVSYKAVHATRGKILRAEPVAALYERRLVHHTSPMKALEREMCHFTGASGESSPDRLDAMVWAVTDLAINPTSSPRIRMV